MSAITTAADSRSQRSVTAGHLPSSEEGKIRASAASTATTTHDQRGASTSWKLTRQPNSAIAPASGPHRRPNASVNTTTRKI